MPVFLVFGGVGVEWSYFYFGCIDYVFVFLCLSLPASVVIASKYSVFTILAFVHTDFLDPMFLTHCLLSHH